MSNMDPLVQAAGGAGRGGGQEGVVNGPVGEHAGEQNAVGALRRLNANKEGISRSVSFCLCPQLPHCVPGLSPAPTAPFPPPFHSHFNVHLQ